MSVAARLGGVVVARKWVDRRPTVDPLTGAVTTDVRTSGTSDADDAALEWALRLAESWDLPLTAVTVGPPGAQSVIRDALAAGAHHGVRVEAPAQLPSVVVAEAVASVCRARGAAVVVCGDVSLDRGSGSVPALVAAALGAAQALGLLALRAHEGRQGQVEGWRRLDGGRRERLDVAAPFVLSVEGAAASLRRASLPGLRRAGEAVIPSMPLEVAVPGDSLPPEPVRRGPFRPRTHVVAPPGPGLDVRRRILALTGALEERTPPQLLVLEPDEAAERILGALAEWEELP